MIDETIPAPGSTTLRALIQACGSGVSDAAMAHARLLGPELAGDTVASLLESELSHPTCGTASIVAAHLAHELRLTCAVPALVHCLEVLPDVHPLAHAALVALARLGMDAVDALLAALHAAPDPEARAGIAEALLRTNVVDDRIRAAFVRVLDDDPAKGAGYLAEYGDARAIPDLARALESDLAAAADCPICASEHGIAIASAIRRLGGTLSEAQRAKVDLLLERQERLWESLEPGFASVDAAPHFVGRTPRPARNAPCPCGSGKKYKKCCHLGGNALSGRH